MKNDRSPVVDGSNEKSRQKKVDEKTAAADYKKMKIGGNSDSETSKENGEEKTPEVKVLVARHATADVPCERAWADMARATRNRRNTYILLHCPILEDGQNIAVEALRGE